MILKEGFENDGVNRVTFSGDSGGWVRCFEDDGDYIVNN